MGDNGKLTGAGSPGSVAQCGWVGMPVVIIYHQWTSDQQLV